MKKCLWKYQKTKHHTLLNYVRNESKHMKKDWKHTPQNDELLLLEKSNLGISLFSIFQSAYNALFHFWHRLCGISFLFMLPGYRLLMILSVKSSLSSCQSPTL